MADGPILVEDTTVLPLIYFVSAEEKERFPIKIGRSTNRAIRKRLSSIQTGMPYKLVFMMVCEADPSVELELHRAFAHIRLQGEWFRRTNAILSFIRDLESDNPEWRELLQPRFVYGPGHEPPPDDPMDLVRYGKTTEDLHWEKKKSEMLVGLRALRSNPLPTL